jgi:hypothetical protein
MSQAKPPDKKEPRQELTDGASMSDQPLRKSQTRGGSDMAKGCDNVGCRDISGVATTRFPGMSLSMEKFAGISRTIPVLPEGYSLFPLEMRVCNTLSFPKKEKGCRALSAQPFLSLEKQEKEVSDLECVNAGSGSGGFSAV